MSQQGEDYNSIKTCLSLPPENAETFRMFLYKYDPQSMDEYTLYRHEGVSRVSICCGRWQKPINDCTCKGLVIVILNKLKAPHAVLISACLTVKPSTTGDTALYPNAKIFDRYTCSILLSVGRMEGGWAAVSKLLCKMSHRCHRPYLEMMDEVQPMGHLMSYSLLCTTHHREIILKPLFVQSAWVWSWKFLISPLL